MRTKEMRGITLIALVITIVIIMILAGVTISLVVGNNNLFDKAKSTQKIQTVAGIKEALELEKVDIQAESKKVDLDTYLEQISTGKKNYNLSSKEKVDEKNAEIIVNDEYKFLVKDKENGDVEIIYDGIAKADDLTISSKNGTYTYPNSGTFEVTNNTSRGELTVSSDASNIATASIDGNTITVKPETVAGKANIIVRSAANGEYAENKVIHVATVKNGTIELEAIPYDGVYDGQAHNAFTSISTKPSDVKLEYSLDGNEYYEEMPTITNTSEFTVTVKASKEGYKTQITTETVKVSKAEGKLTLSATSGTITYPSNTTFTVSGNTGTLSVSSNNNNIATASVSGNTVTVKSGTTAGKAIITVTSAETSNYNEKSATYTATVNNGTISLSATPYNGIYDGKAHNALTNVSANPSDAKLEYSINGGTYSTTMPTITNVSSFTVTIKASKLGYKTQTRTETVKVSKAEGKLMLSATSGTITYPSNTTFTVSGNTGALSVSSNNNNIATASVSGNTVTVKSGTTAGKATITVTSATATNYNAKSATYTATVQNGTISLSATPYTGTYDGKAHNAITNVSVNPSDAKLEYSTNGTTYSTTMPTITNVSSFTVTVRASKAGYKTQSTTQTVKVNKANGSLTLSSYSGILTYPNSGTFSVSGNTGNLSVSSSNTNVVTVSLSGNTVTIIPKTREGSATITVKSAASANYTEKSVTYNVTVQLPHFTASSGVGYYADVDGNGTVDGVIFEDFKVGGSGSWGNRNGTYTIPTVSGTKEYYISKTNYSGPFGTKDVLSAKGSGNNRFYVMALSDVGNDTYLWSEGKKLESNGWIMSERNEWAAFLGNLKISESNYKSFGLKGEYWSSTKVDEFAWVVQFTAVDNYNGYFCRALYNYYYGRPVRFCKKF
ncbi:MAG: hypothetical protein BHW09_08265 [Clostridium sp. CAG:245_30_32]|nr:MAG: hypothetical protein BHW09_08265 [Clostridium sp. CAG:245_30_32]